MDIILIDDSSVTIIDSKTNYNNMNYSRYMQALGALGINDFTRILDNICFVSPAPNVKTFIHRNFALHLYNMGNLWYDLFMYMWKTIYQWIHCSTKTGFKRKERHVLYLDNRCNRVGIFNLKLQSI